MLDHWEDFGFMTERLNGRLKYELDCILSRFLEKEIDETEYKELTLNAVNHYNHCVGCYLVNIPRNK